MRITNSTNIRKGQAAILGVIFLLALSIVISTGLVSFSLRETRGSRLLFASLAAYASAESGVEDVLYRLMNNLNADNTETLSTNSGIVTTTIVDIGNTREVIGEGQIRNSNRRVQTVLLENTIGAAFTYGAQVGYLGLKMGNHAAVRGSIYSNGSIDGESGTVITGDAWVAGGTAKTTDQAQENQTDNLNIRDTSPRRDAAQSFVPTITANIAKVSLSIRKIGTPSNASVYIVPDNGGVPDTGNALADGTLSASNITGNYSWVNVDMDADQGLIEGETYWIVIDNSASHASNYYILGGDGDGSYASGTFKYSSNWSAPSPTWTAPSQGARDGAFRIYMGVENTEISGVNVQNDAHANTIRNANIDGDAYYKTISGSAVGGMSYPGSADPPPENLPLSDGQIEEFKSWGDNGGACGPPICDANGNYSLDSAIGELGPIYVPGNFTVNNGGVLTVNGTIHVGGDVLLNNNCIVQLDESYGALSGIIVADGTIRIDNGAALSGSGTPGSYVTLITTSGQLDNPVALNVNNNATGAIFYALKGAVRIDNNAEIKEVVGNKIILENNTILKYESGLANVQLSSGPTGGYSIDRWNEIE